MYLRGRSQRQPGRDVVRPAASQGAPPVEFDHPEDQAAGRFCSSAPVPRHDSVTELPPDPKARLPSAGGEPPATRCTDETATGGLLPNAATGRLPFFRPAVDEGIRSSPRRVTVRPTRGRCSSAPRSGPALPDVRQADSALGPADSWVPGCSPVVEEVAVYLLEKDRRSARYEGASARRCVAGVRRRSPGGRGWRPRSARAAR
jgi:hypothetical protein